MSTPSATVLVGFTSGGMVHSEFLSSLTGVLMNDAHPDGPRRIVGQAAHITSGAHVPTARCRIVAEFLSHPRQPDWLWMVDTDATFAPNILEQLLASADPVERPIVGALAFGWEPFPVDGSPSVTPEYAQPMRAFPTLYHFTAEGQCLRQNKYPRDEVIRVHSTGAHCVVIHRSVLLDVGWSRWEHPLPWFRGGMAWRGQEVSEDQWFYLQAGSMGYPVHVDTGARTGHVKSLVVTEELFLAQYDAGLYDEG
jgi:hypothetical protein